MSGSIASLATRPTQQRGLFAVLRQDQTYRSLAYLAVSAFLGWQYWLLFTGTLRAVGVGGIIVVLVVLASLLAASWFVAMFERALAVRLLHVSIPPMAPPLAPDLSLSDRLKAHLRNPVTWKALVYLALRIPFVFVFLGAGALLLACFVLLLAPVEYLVVVGVFSTSRFAQYNPLIAPPWPAPAVPLRDLLGFSAGNGSSLALDLAISVGCLLVGMLALLGTLRLVNGVTWLWGRFAVLMLGVNQTDLALAEARAFAAREQARADQADHSRRELILNASHELRTPVASIRAHIESLLILEGEQLPERIRGFLAITQREAERLSALVDDLFMLARADTDELRLDIEPVAVGDLVEEVYQALEPLAEREREVTLVRFVTPDLPPACADRARLAQVLLNLVRNAITYTPAGGLVSLEAGAGDPGLLELAVTDTGIGIPPEDLERVFERFYRTDASRTRGTGGSGLGLSIVRDLVGAMGGTVVAERVPEGGTRFRLTLRAAAEGAPLRT
jgi:two-component system phosphate regulon sensor histidine kinase PhoR